MKYFVTNRIAFFSIVVSLTCTAKHRWAFDANYSIAQECDATGDAMKNFAG